MRTEKLALASDARVAERDEPLPAALCWLISTTAAMGLWAVILTPFFS